MLTKIQKLRDMQIHTKICESAVSLFTYCLTPVYWRVWENSSEGQERDWSVKWLQTILKFRVFYLIWQLPVVTSCQYSTVHVGGQLNVLQ